MQPSAVGQIERKPKTVWLLCSNNVLKYTYLGNWEDRPGNSNIEEDIVREYLSEKGYNEILINKALDKLRITANNYNESLYTNNKMYMDWFADGVKVKPTLRELRNRIADWTLGSTAEKSLCQCRRSDRAGQP